MKIYRFDEYDNVYEYCSEQKAYFFIGKFNGRTQEEFVEEYEKLQDGFDECDR
jgi:hypothetical protein